MVELMMYHGNLVNIFDLKEEDVDVDIIKLGACRINRFLGQTKYAYPVANHLIAGYQYLKDNSGTKLQMKQWLIHEAFESYSGVDLPSPLKAKLLLYKIAEEKALIVVAKELGVKPPDSPSIKKLDEEMMIAEALVLMQNNEYWLNFAKQNNISIDAISKKYIQPRRSEEELKTILDRIWDEVFN